MDVREYRRLANTEKDSLIRIYNPLIKDFSVNYNDGVESKLYTVRAGEIETFNSNVGKHITKHLVDFIINERNVDPLNRNDVDKIYEEIEVKL